MKGKNTKKKKLDATEEEPLKNLALLMAIIPVTPILMLYYFATGRAQNSFILGSGLTVLLTCFSLYGMYKFSTSAEQEAVALNSMVEELTLEQQENLKDEYSTLRQSVGAEKFPPELEAVFDIEQNMLVINYYNYLINAGQIGARGEGAVHILQSTLYGEDRQNAKAAWLALEKINTPQARLIMDNFVKDYEEYLQAKEQEEFIQKSMPKGNSVDFYKNKFKNKMEVIKNSF